MRKAAIALAVTTVFAACDSSTEPSPDPTEWAAELAGLTGHETVEGDASVAAGLTSFTAAIELAGLEPGDYGWEVAAGSCEEPGDRIGAATAYEELTADAEGEANGEATVSATLQSSGSYLVGIFMMDDDERVDIACGELERLD